jgi:hypothetical protein
MLIEVAILAFGRKTLGLTTLELVIVVRRHLHSIVWVHMINLTIGAGCGQVLSAIHLTRLLENLTVIVYLTAGLRRHAQTRTISTSHVIDKTKYL